MVGIALIMLFVVIAGLVLWRRGRLFDTRWYLRLCTWTGAAGFVAVLAGWTTTEVGRQPWVVYGLMRTADAVTPSLTASDVALSLAVYMLAYLVIFGGGYILLRRLVRIGPSPATESEAFDDLARPMRPLSAVTDVVAEPITASRTGARDVT
jgi:cytochrome d ubiquinol oxidase subunit I